MISIHTLTRAPIILRLVSCCWVGFTFSQELARRKILGNWYKSYKLLKSCNLFLSWISSSIAVKSEDNGFGSSPSRDQRIRVSQTTSIVRGKTFNLIYKDSIPCLHFKVMQPYLLHTQRSFFNGTHHLQTKHFLNNC